MKKEIYIITNDINNKVYIGQAINSKERFMNHCKPSAIRDNSLIDKAIHAYGKQHFNFRVIESACEDYNEREKYWINYYNCLTPNGYNILPGGEEPPRYSGIEHPEAVFKSQELLNEVYKDLKETSLSYKELSNKYEVSKTTIGDINKGKVYRNKEIDYPIRKNVNKPGKLNEEDIEIIIERLKFSYDSYETIGKDFEVEGRAISRINQGVFHKKENEIYPIRQYRNTSNPCKLTYQEVTDIINLIQYSDLSLRQIALQYNVLPNIIIGIKSGNTKMYRREGFNYPLRTNN